jgi:predicted small lipoprotein YifL
MNLILKSILIIVSISTIIGCDKKGCTDANANNYDENAIKEDGLCKFDEKVLFQIMAYLMVLFSIPQV